MLTKIKQDNMNEYKTPAGSAKYRSLPSLSHPPFAVGDLHAHGIAVHRQEPGGLREERAAIVELLLAGLPIFHLHHRTHIIRLNSYEFYSPPLLI